MKIINILYLFLLISCSHMDGFGRVQLHLVLCIYEETQAKKCKRRRGGDVLTCMKRFTLKVTLTL